MNLIVFASLFIIVSSEPSPTFKVDFGELVNGNACANPQAYGFVQRAGTQLYYLVSDILLNWVEGETYCQKFGAHLPSASNAQDNEYLKWLIGPLVLQDGVSWNTKTLGAGGYWLGGYRSISTNEWKWTDGEPFVWTNWGSGEPNYMTNKDNVEFFIGENYAVADRKYRGWFDYPKNYDRIVVCQLNCLEYFLLKNYIWQNN